MDGMTSRGDSLGQRIRQAYLRAALNRSQFQRALGVAYSTVLMWERDRTQPNADNLRAISEVTGVPLAELLETGGEAGARARGEVERFLSSKAARGITDAERRTLESVVYHDMEPTQQSLQSLLEAIRLCSKRSH